MLNNNGDLNLGKNGDIVLCHSVRQKIRIRLLWFLGEWRWNKELGLPYLEELLLKNPDTDLFIAQIRKQIKSIPEVTKVESIAISSDSTTRKGVIKFAAIAGEEIIREEVTINV